MFKIIGYFCLAVVAVIVGNIFYKRINDEARNKVTKNIKDSVPKVPENTEWKSISEFPGWEMANTTQGFVVRNIEKSLEFIDETMTKCFGYIRSQQVS